MNRIVSRFAALRAKQRKALIPFITAGDPHPELTVPLMHDLVSVGADVLELGVPFSDPMADGPVIQRSSERALKHGVTLSDVMAMVDQFRQRDSTTPVVLMGYLNPIETMGSEPFAAAAQRAGVDGVLTVDLPPEEASLYLSALEQHTLAPIFLISPTTSDERIAYICKHARGFVYYVSLKGVTGSNQLDVAAAAERVAAIRRHTDLPVGVGFGIKDADSAKRIAAVTDGVVIGSALVAKMEALATDTARLRGEACQFVTELRTALDETTRGHDKSGS